MLPTYSVYVSEEGVCGRCERAVPAHVPELELALGGGERHSVSDGDDGVGPAAADGPLTRRQARHLVADDAGAESDDGRQRAVHAEEDVAIEVDIDEEHVPAPTWCRPVSATRPRCHVARGVRRDRREVPSGYTPRRRLRRRRRRPRRRLRRRHGVSRTRVTETAVERRHGSGVSSSD